MSSNNQPQIISSKTLQITIGIIGITLPIILLLGSVIIDNCCDVQSSISNYYYTKMRNVLVGYLFALSLFLWAYKGYPGSFWDSILGNIACVLGLGIIFLPTAISTAELSSCITTIVDMSIIGILHLVSAASFLTVLALFSIFIFTKGDNNPTPQKIKRNILYRICGYIMLFTILLMAIYVGFIRTPFPNLEKLSPVFWLEAIALWAFGLSWLTKGEMILKDVN